MIVRRMFSKKSDDRDNKDKSWDSVYGAGVGAAVGSLGSATIYKNTKDIRNFDRDKFVKSYKADRLNHLNSEIDRLSNSGNPTDKLAIPDVKKEASGIAKEVNEKVRNAKIKKGLAKTGIIALPILGSVLGSLYGRDNDLRKQRRKMEDAAGDKVAESIKNIGNKNEKKKS